MSDRNKGGAGEMDNSCGYRTDAGWIIPRKEVINKRKAEGHCTHFLLLGNKITTNLVVIHIFIISASVSQEPGNSLAESSAYALTRLQSRYQPGCSHLEAQVGTNTLPCSFKLSAGLFSLRLHD